MLVVFQLLVLVAFLFLLVQYLLLFGYPFVLVGVVRCWSLVLVAARYDLAARNVLLGRVLLVVDLPVL